MIDLLFIVAAACIPSAYLLGRWTELRHVTDALDHADEAIAGASRLIDEYQHAEAEALRIVAAQRELLTTFTDAAERLNHPGAGWLATEQIAWAAHRARTEVL